MNRSRRVAVALAVGALLVAACGGSGATVAPAPSPTASPTPSPSPTATDPPTQPATEASTEVAPDPPTETPSPEPTVAPITRADLRIESAGYLAAGPDGITALVDGEFVTLFDQPVATGFDDGAGGAVFQFSDDDFGDRSGTSIWHLAAGAPEAVVLIPADDDNGLVLHDVAVIAGATHVVYTSRSGDTPETSGQALFTYAMADGSDRALGLVGGWESGVHPVSMGGDRYVLNTFSEGFSWLDFLDASGADVREPHNPVTVDDPCFDEVTCPQWAELDESGRLLAYTQLEVDETDVIDGWRLVVTDLGTGASLLEWSVASEPGYWPQRTQFLGGLVIVTMAGFADDGPTYLEPWVFDLTGEEPEAFRVALRGVASFLRGAG